MFQQEAGIFNCRSNHEIQYTSCKYLMPGTHDFGVKSVVVKERFTNVKYNGLHFSMSNN